MTAKLALGRVIAKRAATQPHDTLTDVEIMECIDAVGRRVRLPAIGDGKSNAIKTCMHAFPQHGHSRPMTIRRIDNR